MSVSHVTTHILDTSSGKPAARVAVELFAADGTTWTHLAAGVTNDAGRIPELGPEVLAPGTYQLRFGTGAYFARTATETFFPEVVLTFTVTAGEDHYHVPLLLSPFSYSTYRGN
ncbi:hydroxyisourate hydrolase [Arthrobacter sp. 35W]|uniref:hydroxyisourate hydrolase n=1 Tax=Arthrobacter sp. 35W TaxID=1132441 RepID=UPI000403A37A|nr:hydroxyisourate hydrolase [Arthrobacter sp. 35W]